MKKLLLIFFFFLFLCGSAWADSIIIRPDGDEGTNDWTPTNCVDHYDCVNEVTVDESDYLSEATYLQTDRWTLENASATLTAGQRIDSVFVTYRAKRNGVTTINVALYIGSDKTYAGSHDPGASWTTYSEKIDVPGTLRSYWTIANLDNTDILINKTGDDANTVDVCWVYVTVYYTPETFNRFGAQSEDDGQETVEGFVNTNFVYIELMRVMTPQRYYAAYRFPNVKISQGVTINSAYIGLRSYGAPFYDPIDTIACEDVDSTTVLEGGSITWDISERWANATSAVVFWDEDDVGDTPTVPDSTPDLKTLVQEVVDRPGWKSGNAMTFLFRNMIIDLDSCQYETHSWDGSGNEIGGILLIEYEEAADYDIDTLRQIDENQADWVESGCADEPWLCVDDPIGSPDDYATFVFHGNASMRETFVSDSTFFTDIDSVVIFLRTLCAGGDEVDTLEVGWDYYSEATWYWNKDGEIILNTSFTTYSTKLTGSWTYQDVNAKRFGFRIDLDPNITQEMVTQMYIFVYGVKPEEAEAKPSPRRRKLLKLMGQ